MPETTRRCCHSSADLLSSYVQVPWAFPSARTEVLRFATRSFQARARAICHSIIRLVYSFRTLDGYSPPIKERSGKHLLGCDILCRLIRVPLSWRASFCFLTSNSISSWRELSGCPNKRLQYPNRLLLKITLAIPCFFLAFSSSLLLFWHVTWEEREKTKHHSIICHGSTFSCLPCVPKLHFTVPASFVAKLLPGASAGQYK